MTSDTPSLQILLHAPTASGLLRARNNAANILEADATATVRIVVNSEGLAAALDSPDPHGDALTLVCPNTLRRLGRRAAPSMTVLSVAAALSLAVMQRDGWIYVRA